MTNDRDPVSFPPRVKLAHTPTPLHLLPRISKELGTRVWIKRDDLTGSALSGNKIRKLEFVIQQALSEGCDTLITCGGVQSNHCRATALAGAQLGLKVCLILRNDSGTDFDGNLLLDGLAGAEIYIYQPRDYRKQLADLFSSHQARIAQTGSKAFCIPTGASDEIGVWGYIAAAAELKNDFTQQKIVPHSIVVATGSGGTQAGLTAGAYLYQLPAQVIGMAVCDDEQYFIDKVTADLTRWQSRYQVQCELNELSINVNAHYIGPGYALAGPEIYQCLQWLASNEGIVLDPVYTGKAFYGMVQEIRNGGLPKNADIVFVHTGGIFGLFPKRLEFDFRPLLQ